MFKQLLTLLNYFSHFGPQIGESTEARKEAFEAHLKKFVSETANKSALVEELGLTTGGM